MKSFSRVLIANRGEPGARIARTLRKMGIAPVALVPKGERAPAWASDALPGAGDGLAAYLDAKTIVTAATSARIDAIHPGWGFLSERAEFSRLVEASGIVFIGPTAEQMESLGDKATAKEIARALGLPLIASTMDESAMAGMSFPILLKPAAGGGGKGMIVVRHPKDLAASLERSRREALAAFGDDRVMAETYVERLLHVEIQVLGDGQGKVWTLGERDCTVQRRHQKIVEESPSPFLDGTTRAKLEGYARTLAEHVSYRSAGTVEFMIDAAGRSYFMEMNTRLQVEHGVTEERFRLDLVEAQVRLARGESIEVPTKPTPMHVIQVRVYAEDPYENFLPSTGEILAWHPPSEVRVDHDLREGDRIDHHFDPMLAKVIVAGSDRAQAISNLRGALSQTALLGVNTNLNYLDWVLSHADFRDARHHTRWTQETLEAYRAFESSFDLGEVARLMEPSRGTSVEGATQAPTPWETLPSWRIGGAR